MDSNMEWKIPIFKIYWDKEDIKSISKIIKAGMHWAEGPSIKEFEDKIARYIGIRHCIVFNSGTSALHALLLAYGISEGDEIIVPSFTFITTANAPLFVGAKPVFADIEEETFGLDPEDVKKKITPKTKAIIPVHYGGCPCKIRELKRIAEEHNLLLIEDAAEAFGAKINDKKIGTFGSSAVFSFCQNKIITTGEGGAAVTNSGDIYEKLKLTRSHGRTEINNYFSSTGIPNYITLGYNFRMPSFVAALGLAQLRKVNKIIKMRRKKAVYMDKRLAQEVKDFVVIGQPKGYFHVHQLYTVRIKKYRDELKKYLASRGIMSKIYFSPVHSTPFYISKFRTKYELPVTEKISKQVLSLPMYPTLRKEEIDCIIEEIKNFYRGKK